MSRPPSWMFALGATALVAAGAGGYGLARLTAKPAHTAPEEANTKPEAAKDRLILTPAALASAQIEVREVAPGALAGEILAPATVAPLPGGEAVLTAGAAGRVTRVLKRLGDPVRAGETVAIVQSRDAAGLAADRTTAQAKATLAQRNLARERSLFDQRVSPRVDLEQAEAEAAAANAEVRRAEVALQTARVSRDGSGVSVVSPITGRIAAMPASLGAFVQPETELIRVADASAVQVEARVGGADVGRVAPGDRVEFQAADGRLIGGRVRGVTPSLDPATRAATVVLDLATTGLRPGETGRVRIFPTARVSAVAVMVIPDEAVQTLSGADVVFVRTADGFQARRVRVAQRSAGRAEIADGLRAGERIAVRNAFLLKAELAKGEGDED